MNNFSVIDTKKLIYNLCLTAMFVSMSIIAKLISSYFPPIINGYHIEIQIVIYVLGLFSLFEYKYKFLLLILCPCLWFFIGSNAYINPIQIFVEYFLSYFIFLPIIFLKINSNNKLKSMLLFIPLFVLLTVIRLMIHIISGVIWWTNNDWLFSFLFNSQIIFSNFLINIILISILFYPCMLIKKSNNFNNLKNKCSCIKKKDKIYYI